MSFVCGFPQAIAGMKGAETSSSGSVSTFKRFFPKLIIHNHLAIQHQYPV
jgi:hypothetical protein